MGGLLATTYPWTHLIELRELLERLGLFGKMLPARREANEFDLERAIDEISAVLPVSESSGETARCASLTWRC